MKRLFWTIIPLLVLALSLLLPKAAGAYPVNFPHTATAYDVIAEVNTLRASQGLLPYQVNSTLMTIAQTHAEYQASTGVLSHYSADGSRPYQRAIAAGYPVAGDLARGGFFSENIHAGSNLSAADVVDAWQADSLHLNTMISPDLKDIGVGVAIVDGISYYTLDAGLSTDEAESDTTSDPNGTSPPSTPGTAVSAQPVITSTPLEDGSVYHEVQANEALWSIALAYNTTVDDLKKLNRLSTNDIFIGQKLLIKSAKGADTPTPAPSITATFGIPTSTATRPVTPSATSTATPLPVPPASRQTGELMVGGIVLAALLAAGLGSWLGRKRST